MDGKGRGEKTQKLFCCVILLISVAVLYIAHNLVPFMMDDTWYATKLYSEEPVQGLKDIVESQIWHYNNWGGRSMGHSLLQMILLLGETFADILNVITTFVLGLVICLVAGIRKARQLPLALLAAIGMTLGLNANWKMSMFWQSGAANYLYMTVFILLFLLCFLLQLGKRNEKAGLFPEVMKGALMIPLGLITGWSNENMGPAAWIISVLVILMVKREKGRIHPWMICGSVSSLLGSIMVIVAPGNFVRSAQVPENEYGLFWRLFLRGYAEAKAGLEYLFPVLLVLVAMLILVKGVLRISIGRENVLLLLCALLSWGAMVLSPHYPDRATFGTMVLIICVIISLGKKLLEARRDLHLWIFGATLLIWLRGMFFLGEYITYCWGWIK